MERFLNRVKKSDGCWRWGGYCNPSGYGEFWVNGRKVGAHRFAWELENGPIPDGMLVCHRCDNPSCVRPDHLFIGTYTDNIRDMMAKDRQNWASGDDHWSRTTPEKVPRGETHSSAKLTAADVRVIRRRYADGGCSYRGLAAEYGVTHEAIGAAVRRRSWKHI